MKKQLCIIGLGYIGLPTAAFMANAGHAVHGVDIKEDTVSIINAGNVHIAELNLKEAIRKAVDSNRLHASVKAVEADVFMICVPTPVREEEKIPIPDTSHVFAAVESIAPFIRPGNFIILESTSPVGTTQRIADRLTKLGVDISKIHIAYCPERVIPGRAMMELLENDRIVGGLTQEAAEEIAIFYRTVVNGRVFTTNAPTAEMAKLTENSFRDVNIAFANEISLVASNAGVDVWDLITLANHHPRVNILQPGPGVGGHCIAVDPWFLVAGDPENTPLIATARKVNDDKTQWVIEQIKIAAADASAKLNRSPNIVLLGLAFKPDIDDLRGSPAIKIAEALYSQGYTIHCVEPYITEHATLPLTNLETALETADIVVALVKHTVFCSKDFLKKMRKSKVLDFCGIFFDSLK